MLKDYKAELNDKGIAVFTPKGTSMTPFLKSKGQTVIVNKKTERLNPLDAGLYITEKGEYVLHRVIEVIDNGYIFTGDFYNQRDFVPEENVLAVMIGFYKGKKFVDTTSPKYKKKIEKFYSGKVKDKKIKRIRRIMKIKGIILRVIRGKKNV